MYASCLPHDLNRCGISFGDHMGSKPISKLQFFVKHHYLIAFVRMVPKFVINMLVFLSSFRCLFVCTAFFACLYFSFISNFALDTNFLLFHFIMLVESVFQQTRSTRAHMDHIRMEQSKWLKICLCFVCQKQKKFLNSLVACFNAWLWASPIVMKQAKFYHIFTCPQAKLKISGKVFSFSFSKIDKKRKNKKSRKQKWTNERSLFYFLCQHRPEHWTIVFN